MTEVQASRTLVKSPPELWAECSGADSLARHLDQFGEIRITRLDPETTVAWEGEEVSGTVKLEPSGWGTRVTLTLESDDDPPPQEPEPKPAPSPLPPAARKRGLFGRLFGRVKPLEPPNTRVPIVVTPPAPPRADRSPVLQAALDSLGSAHHRPFSRA